MPTVGRMRGNLMRQKTPQAVAPSTRYPVPNTHENGGTYMRYVTGAETARGGERDDIPLERVDLRAPARQRGVRVLAGQGAFGGGDHVAGLDRSAVDDVQPFGYAGIKKRVLRAGILVDVQRRVVNGDEARVVRGALAEAEKAAQTTLALPIYPELTERQCDHVVQTTVNFVGQHAALLAGDRAPNRQTGQQQQTQQGFDPVKGQ